MYLPLHDQWRGRLFSSSNQLIHFVMVFLHLNCTSREMFKGRVSEECELQEGVMQWSLGRGRKIVFYSLMATGNARCVSESEGNEHPHHWLLCNLAKCNQMHYLLSTCVFFIPAPYDHGRQGQRKNINCLECKVCNQFSYEVLMKGREEEEETMLLVL